MRGMYAAKNFLPQTAKMLLHHRRREDRHREGKIELGVRTAVSHAASAVVVGDEMLLHSLPGYEEIMIEIIAS